MKKRTTGCSFAVLTLILIGYSIWCLRLEIFGPRIVFPEGVPDSARQIARNSLCEGLQKLDSRRLINLFAKPFDSRREPLKAELWRDPETDYWSVGIPYIYIWRFDETPDGWQLIDEGPLRSTH